MAEPTVAEMLVSVRTAINNALLSGGAVEWEFNGRRVKHDYNQLLDIETRLMTRQGSESGSGSRAFAEFGERPS